MNIVNTSRSIAVFACLFAGNLLPCFSQSNKNEKLFLVCGDSKVLVVDYNKSNDSIPTVIWSWNAQQARDLPEPYRKNKFNGMDDCKAINGGRQILVSSSSGGGIAILDVEGGKVVFYASVPNAHSVAKVPGNRVVAASSTAKDGNKIILFNVRHPELPLATDSLYSAHGLVWNKKTNSLFALGYNVLREYKLGSFHNLQLMRSWPIPGEGGHDLQLAPSGKVLFLSAHKGCWQFDLKKHQFSKIPGFTDHPNVKSIGQDESGQFILTIPEESWWTFHVRFLNPERKMVFRGLRVYKARWFRGKWAGDSKK